MAFYMIYDDKKLSSSLVSSIRRVSEITGVSRNVLWGYFSRGTTRTPVRLVFQKYPFVIIKAESLEKQAKRGNNALGKNKFGTINKTNDTNGILTQNAKPSRGKQKK